MSKTTKVIIHAMKENIERATLEMLKAKLEMIEDFSAYNRSQYRYWEGQVNGLKQQLELFKYVMNIKD